MSKVKIRKKSLSKFGILSASLLLSIGCSGLHGVSVISHGNEAAGIEEAVSGNEKVPASAPPVVGLAPPQFEQEEKNCLEIVPSRNEILPV